MFGSTLALTGRHGKKGHKRIPSGRAVGLAKPDPGVEQGVGDVHDDVGYHHEYGGDEDEPDDHREVALVDRLHRVLADAAEPNTFSKTTPPPSRTPTSMPSWDTTGASADHSPC